MGDQELTKQFELNITVLNDDLNCEEIFRPSLHQPGKRIRKCILTEVS
jgi:hypothetical protein